MFDRSSRFILMCVFFLVSTLSYADETEKFQNLANRIKEWHISLNVFQENLNVGLTSLELPPVKLALMDVNFVTRMVGNLNSIDTKPQNYSAPDDQIFNFDGKNGQKARMNALHHQLEGFFDHLESRQNDLQNQATKVKITQVMTLIESYLNILDNYSLNENSIGARINHLSKFAKRKPNLTRTYRVETCRRAAMAHINTVLPKLEIGLSALIDQTFSAIGIASPTIEPEDSDLDKSFEIPDFL